MVQAISEGGVSLEASAATTVSPPLALGDPAPWFIACSDANPAFRFHSLGGRSVVLSFLRSISQNDSTAVFQGLMAGARRLGAFTTALLLVTADPRTVRDTHFPKQSGK